MPPKVKSRSRWTPVLIVVAVLFVIAGFWTQFWMKKKPQPVVAAPPGQMRTPAASAPGKMRTPAASAPVIDYNQIQTNPALKAEMAKRKAEYGVNDKDVDIIARGNESIRIGKTTIPLSEIMDKIRLKRGEIVEHKLGQNTDTFNEAENSENGNSQTQIYGIHVVQPGDNIWDIHFRFLKDFFKKKGITVSRFADQPLRGGRSSGVGKILKFSERMVYIYNLREKRVDFNLNRLEPGTKLVIFNIGKALALLKNIDYREINQIQFDGQTLWIPAQP